MADDIRLSGVKFVAQDFRSFHSTIVAANRDIDSLNSSIRNLTDNISGFSGRTTRSIDSALGVSTKKVGLFSTSVRNSGKDLLGMASDMTIVVRGLLDLAQTVGRVTGDILSITTGFESGFAGIAKTVEGLAIVDDSGFLKLTESGQALKDELKELSGQVPITFEDLSEIAQLGGQLGIVEGLEDVEDVRETLVAFTETIGGLSEATDLTREEAATSLSQLVNLYRDEIGNVGDEVRTLGNVIVELGNTSATTESKILNIGRRIAAAGKIAGLNTAEVLGLGAAITSLGVTSEAGGTAASKALILMQQSISTAGSEIVDNTEKIEDYQDKLSDLNAKLVRLEAQTGITGESLVEQQQAFIAAGGSVEDFGRQLGDTRRQQLFNTQKDIQALTEDLAVLRSEQGKPVSTKQLELFADTIGITTDAFVALAEEKPGEALTLFVEGLARVDAEGGDSAKILKDLGLGSSEAQRTFLGLASAGDLLRESLFKANEEAATGNALADEVAKRYATLESRFEIFQNRVRAVVDTLTVGLIPGLGNALTTAGDMVEVFGDRVPTTLVNLQTSLQPITDALSDLGIDFTFDPVSIIETGFDNLDTFLTGLDLAPAVETVMGPLTPILEGLTENIDLVIAGLQGMSIAVGSAVLIGGITTLGATITTALLSPLGLLAIAGAGIGIALETNFLGINDTLDAITPTVQANLITLQETVNKFIEDLDTSGAQDAFLNLGVPQEVIDSAITFGDALSTSVLGSVESLSENISGLVTSISTFATSESGTKVVDFVTELSNSLIGFPITDAEGLGKFLGSIVSIPINIITDLVLFVDGVTQFVDGVISANDRLMQSGALNMGQAILDRLVSPLQLIPDTGFEFSIDLSLVLDETALSDIQAPELRAEQLFELPPEEESRSILIDYMEGVLNDAADELANTRITWDTRQIFNLSEPIQILPDDFKVEEADIVNSLIIRINRILDLLGDAVGAVTIAPLLSLVEQDIITIPTREDFTTYLNQLMPQVLTDLSNFFVNFDFTFTPKEVEVNDIVTVTVDEPEQFITDLKARLTELFGGIDLDDLTVPKLTITVSQLSFIIAQGASDFRTDLAMSLAEMFDPEDFTIPILTIPVSEVKLDVAQGVLNILDAFLDPVQEAISYIQTSFTDVLGGVDIGIPGFTGITDAVDDIITSIRTKISELEFFGVTPFEDLAPPEVELDIELDTESLDEINDTMADLPGEMQKSFAQGVNMFLPGFGADSLRVANEITDSVAKGLGVQSLSPIFIGMGQDVILSIAKGMEDLSAIMQALERLRSAIITFSSSNDLLMGSFDDLSTRLTSLNTTVIPGSVTMIEGEMVPTIQLWNEELIFLAVTIEDIIIPAMLSMDNTGRQLIGTLENLYDRVRNLATALTGELFPAYVRIRDEQGKAVESVKELKEQVDLLVQSYLLLAEAVKSAGDAGAGTPTAPAAPGAGTGGGATPFQTGGSFIVPSNIPREVLGKTGGMNIEVHSGELVQVIPKGITKALTSIPESLNRQPGLIQSPKVSGAPTNNAVTNNFNNQNSQPSYSLHIVEAPSRDIRDSFDLMRVLGGG